ncbi:MAG: hypothetical protein AAF662_01900 [Pseudomonadota bacterium]
MKTPGTLRLLKGTLAAVCLTILSVGTTAATLNANDTVTLTTFDNYDFTLGDNVSRVILNLRGSSEIGVVTFAVVDGIFKATNNLAVGGGASFTVDTSDSALNLTVAPLAAGAFTLDVTAVPIPAAAWLFGTAVLGMTLVSRRRAKTIDTPAGS